MPAAYCERPDTSEASIAAITKSVDVNITDVANTFQSQYPDLRFMYILAVILLYVLPSPEAFGSVLPNSMSSSGPSGSAYGCHCTIVEFSTSNFPGRLPLAIKAFLPTNVIFESSSLTITTWSF